MRKLLLVIFLFVGFRAFSARLVLKIQPDLRVSFSDKNSPCRKVLSGFGLQDPERRFPFHQALKEENSGNSLMAKTDLSLIFSIEVPEPMKTAFLLKQVRQLPGIFYAEWEENLASPLNMPNDPAADSVSGSQRQVLKKIRAYEAWALSQGDSNVVIGLLDTGTPVLHEEFAKSIKYNFADPVNGIDDDQNGLVDDFRGWDFGSNDSDPTPDNNGTSPGHGTSVSSLAGATTNNGIGISGIAWKCKILPVKIWNWAGTFSNFSGYEAIVYAADMGCKVINCSWGSPGSGSQFEQDIIRYATFNKGALVVAAGGNTAGYYNFLPANYDYVTGVSMTDTTDRIFWAASRNYKLDLLAPGVGVYGIKTDGNYGWVEGGTSMSSPMVAGAAALVLSKYPDLSGLQAGELLRVNSDSVYSISGNAGYRDQAGRGRLNILKALQKEQHISIRAVDCKMRNRQGILARPGDTLGVFLRFENYLDSINSYSVKVWSSSSDLIFLENSRIFGPIGSLQFHDMAIPFSAVVNPSLAVSKDVAIRVDITAGNYTDHRWFTLSLNAAWLDLDRNFVQITATQNGRFGFADAYGYQGSGIRYKGIQVCGEAGLMLGTGPDKVSNCVYNSSSIDQHFRAENAISFTNYPGISQHAQVHLNDSAAGSSAIGLGIKQSVFEMEDDGLSGSVFINYQVSNRNSYSLDSLCVAMYNDWEVENPGNNQCAWIDSLGLGVTAGEAFRKRFVGTQILGAIEPQFFAIDALPTEAGNNINLFDGFSLAEKWKTMSNGLARLQAGVLGNNVVQVSGAKLRNMQAGETRKIAFAYVFADSLPELIKRAQANRAFFRKQNTSPSPELRHSSLCLGDTIAILPETAITNLAVYSDSISSQPVFTGPDFSGKVFSDSVLYVAGRDSLFEGPRRIWNWKAFAKPNAGFSTNIVWPGGDTVILFYSVKFMAAADSAVSEWYFDGSFIPGSAGLDTLDFYFNPFDSIQEICLEKLDTITGCSSRFCRTFRVFLVTKIKNLPISNGIFYQLKPGNLLEISTTREGEMELLDLQGRKLISSIIRVGSNRVDCRGIPPGIYLLKIRGATDVFFSRVHLLGE